MVVSLDWVPVSGVELLFGNRDTADSKERGSPFESQGIILCARVLMKPRIFLGWSLQECPLRAWDPACIPAQGRVSENWLNWSFPSDREQTGRRFSGTGSLLRQGAQLQVLSLPCPVLHGGSGLTGQGSADLAHSSPGTVSSQLIGSFMIGLRQEPGGSQPIE